MLKERALRLIFLSLILELGFAVAMFVPVMHISRTFAYDGRNPAFSSRDEVLFLSTSPFTGQVLEYFPNGNVAKETHYKDGRKDGIFRQFGFQENLVVQGQYANGKKEGIELGWYNEGPRQYEFHYKFGLFDGEQMRWHQNGAVFRREVYVEGTLIDKKILYANGQVFTNYATRENRIYGLDGGRLCMENKSDGVK